MDSELKKLENNLEISDNLRKYETPKRDLELIYNYAVEGVRIRSKCNWPEHWQKNRGNQNRIRRLIQNEKEINNEIETLNQAKRFYETLFQNP